MARLPKPGLSRPFLGLGPGALGIGKNSGVFLKIGKKQDIFCYPSCIQPECF